ncbi:hypothetical protein OG216_06500 [Streptomycetaceae bacterium NBC_01309]
MPAWSRLRAVRAALFAAVCVTLAVSGHVFMSDSPVPWWAPAAALPVLTALTWLAAGRERGLPAIGVALVGAQTVLHSLFGWAQQTTTGSGSATGSAAAAGSAAQQTEAAWLRFLLCNEDAPAPAGTTRSAARLLDQMGLDPALAALPPGQGPFGGSGFGTAGGFGPGSGAAHDMGAAAAAHGSHAASILPTHGGVGMLLAHLAAGLGSALWLWRGDKALFDLLRLLASRTRCLGALLRAWLRWGEPAFPQVPFVRPRPAFATARRHLRPLSRRGPPLTVFA